MTTFGSWSFANSGSSKLFLFPKFRERLKVRQGNITDHFIRPGQAVTFRFRLRKLSKIGEIFQIFSRYIQNIPVHYTFKFKPKVSTPK